MNFKLSLALLVLVLGASSALDPMDSAPAENDERLAALEELLWMQKLPKLYLLKLKHLAEQRLENDFDNGPPAPPASVFSDNRIRRGGKYEGLRRYGRR